MKNFINYKKLNEKLQENDVIIVDCRFELGDAFYGRECYLKGHIKNAHYLDINKDLAGEEKVHGGRHPLPEIKDFIEKIESIGINEKSTVIAYDQGDLCGASRFWWLMKYIGHSKVYVLEGGIKQWLQAGYPVEDENYQVEKSVYKYSINPDILVSMEEVAYLSKNNKGTIIDSRSFERFTGEVESIDKKAGHIKNACNLFWMDIFNGESLKSIEELKVHFEKVIKGLPIVVHCGSGITGAVNFIVLDELGIQCKLYAGSWSDWISYDENEVITGK